MQGLGVFSQLRTTVLDRRILLRIPGELTFVGIHIRCAILPKDFQSFVNKNSNKPTDVGSEAQG